MSRKVFYAFMIVALIAGVVGFAAARPAAKPSVTAIGALPVNGVHLVPAREDAMLRTLEAAGRISKDSTEVEIQQAVEEYRSEFAKDSISWVNPEIAAASEQREKDLATESKLAEAVEIPNVSVTIFGIAVEFAKDGTPFTGTDCDGYTATFDGPAAGEVPAPDAGDNATIWYPDTSDMDVYRNITFGYEGAGVVRTDLNSGAGVDLSGYTVQDYYDHVSGAPGRVTLLGDFYGWVEVPHGEEYYGAPICDEDGYEVTHDVNAEILVVDALKAFNDEHPDFDWKQYDQNDDKVIDTLWILHAGLGQETGGGYQGGFSLWSHSSDLRYYNAFPEGYQVAGAGTATTADDVFAGPYTMNPEMADVGVLSEEFGHNVFGLPDMYTTDVQNSIGFWNIMSAGSYGGPLAGAAPAGMPLWFRMVAVCGEDDNSQPVYCNWHAPMLLREYDDPSQIVEVGQLEDTPVDTYKGVRINLPNVDELVPNYAGSGAGAWSGNGRDGVDVLLTRSISVPASGAIFNFDSYWEIEEDWDYGYVVVKVGNGNWTYLKDMDGIFTNTNPNGNNKGWGLTGFADDVTTIRVDLGAFKGQTITLGLLYETDAAANEKGWWVDNVKLNNVLLDDFSKAVDPSTFPGWANSEDTPWFVVPIQRSYPNYYLLEWRAETKYDQWVQSAYITTDNTPTKWTVTRVPYNIPGGLLYYRNAKYPEGYSQRQYYMDPPSIGPKNKLLIVDMNPPAVLIGDSGYLFNNRVSAYDAAITLQDTEAFNVSTVFGVPGVTPFTVASKPAVSEFYDGQGYYPGYCIDWDTFGLYYMFRDASVVIPAAGPYSTKLVDCATENPAYDLYQVGYGPSWLGSGNPADDNVHYGVNVQLMDQGVDGDRGIFNITNYAVDIIPTPHVNRIANGPDTLTYSIDVVNRGRIDASDIVVVLELPAGVSVVSTTGSPTVGGGGAIWNIPSLPAGESTTVEIEVTAGEDGYWSGWAVIYGYDGKIDRDAVFFQAEIPIVSFLPNIGK